MASSGVILNAVPVSNYTTPVNASLFTAVTAHPADKTSTSAGTSSVTAAAGALFRGSRGFLSLFSSRYTAGSAGEMRCMKPHPPTTLTSESTDCTVNFATGEGFPNPSKQTNPFRSERANFAPSEQADTTFRYTTAPEPLNYTPDGDEDFSLLSEDMDPYVMYPQCSQNGGTTNSSRNRTPPAGGKFLRYYFSGLTGALRNFGRPATTWVHPDYINNQELPYNFANLDSKINRQYPQKTHATSRSPLAAPAHQQKRFGIQDTDFGQTFRSPLENSFCCGDPQLKDSSRTSGSNIPMWSNAELCSAQTEDLLAARREPKKFLAEQNKQYHYYSNIHQQKMQQHQQPNQTTDDSCMVDDGWDIVMNEAGVPPDEQCWCTEAAYLTDENVTSELEETAMAGTYNFFYSESSDNCLLEACLPPQSTGFDYFNTQLWSSNGESINSKSEEARRSETVPPHIKSQLNPNAKEWTGVSCSKIKLNPEAKEWVPKDYWDGRVKMQTETITETDVENDLVLITINSASIENESNDDKGIMNDSCSSEIGQKDSRKECMETDADCNRIDGKSARESELSNSSVNQKETCLVASPLTISSSLVCESVSDKSTLSGVISCPVPEISAKVVEFACDTSLLDLYCVNSICSNIDSDSSDCKVSCEAAAVASIISKVNPQQERKEQKVSDEEKRCRYHSETRESSDCESDQDVESDVESVLCARSGYRAKPHPAESSEDESSEDESSEDENSEEETEEESESEDLVIGLLHTPCGWWENGRDSGDDSSDDEDDESVKDDGDLDTETDDDIVFDCSVDEADCTSVKDKTSKRCLSALQKVNLRWNSQINENVIGPTCCKISFNEVVRVDSVDKNIERSGVEWERYAMEAKRFLENVLQPHGAIISRVLGAEHRSRIFRERFAEAVNMDADGGITIVDAGQTLRVDGQASDKDIFIKIMCKGAHDVCRHAFSDRSCSCETDKNPDSVKTVCVK